MVQVAIPKKIFFVEWFRQDYGVDNYEDSAIGLAGAAILKMTGSFHGNDTWSSGLKNGNENEGMTMSPTDELRPGYGNGIWLLRAESLQLLGSGPIDLDERQQTVSVTKRLKGNKIKSLWMAMILPAINTS